MVKDVINKHNLFGQGKYGRRIENHVKPEAR